MDEGLGQDLQIENEAPELAPVPQEKMLTQSEVNSLVGRAKQEAKHKAIEEYKRTQANVDAPSSSRDDYESAMRKIAAEELERHRDEWTSAQRQKYEAEHAQKVVDTFYQKIEGGKDKFEDFENVVNGVNLSRYPNVVQMLAEHADNADEVLYELAKNRSKLMALQTQAKDYPEDAVYEFKKLADSIKKNQQANNIRTPNEPLSQNRPSNGAVTGGPLSMADLKLKYRG